MTRSPETRKGMTSTEWLLRVHPIIEKIRAELRAEAEASERAAMIEIPHFLKPHTRMNDDLMRKAGIPMPRYNLLTGRMEAVRSDGMDKDYADHIRKHGGGVMPSWD